MIFTINFRNNYTMFAVTSGFGRIRIIVSEKEGLIIFVYKAGERQHTATTRLHPKFRNLGDVRDPAHHRARLWLRPGACGGRGNYY
jgi:hypothetical protein